MGLLDGKVALVTGAGGGLGRAHAMLFAREGARVVVNDLGGSRDGSGASASMADKVVEEIRAAGGEAVANHASVTDPEGVLSMFDDAAEHFGKIDIVVNNAGILRDKTLTKMTDEMFDLVIAVHLKGTFLVTREAVNRMRAQGTGGRIINTSSIAGLKGNFGQANYGAAKAGIAGLTRVVAIETQRAGITVNALAPVAKTRMTEDIEMVPDNYEPEDISPLVAWLASDAASEVTGRVFGAHGSHYFEYRVELTQGVEKKGRWEVAEVGARFGDIAAFGAPAAPAAPAAAAAAPADASPEARVKALFAAMPNAFKAEKAGGWEATIHFDVTGTGAYSLVVAGGACAFHEGAHGSPTGKVTFDAAETLLSMSAGKIKPEQAFMAGKIKADNMALLMDFGKYFDMRKAAELAASGAAASGGSSSGAAASAAPQDPGALVDEAFERMGEAFVAEKAAGWNTTLNFKVGADRGYTVQIKEQTVKTAKGLDPDPKGTISFDTVETYLGVIQGKINPQQAFMAGKIKADNIAELMRYAQCFDMKRAAEAASASAPAASKASTSAGLNRALIGRRYRASAFFIKPEELAAYAAATEDGNADYQVGAAQIAPPIFPVRPLMDVVGMCVADEELNADLLRLVHGEQEMFFHRPLRPWDLVNPRAEVLSIEDKSSGQVVKVRQWLNVDGEAVNETISSYFIRGEKKAGAATAAPSAPEPPPAREIVHEASQLVAQDQPTRYGHASGDMNPIHMDEKVAKAAGHPTVILHGLCTMAFAAKALVDGICGGDSRKLKRLSVRFSKPVLPGWTLTTRIWREEAQGGRTLYGLETVNQDGTPVLTNAQAEVE